MLDKVVMPLLAWYDEKARILPWREHVTPYRVWVSEIMLQQTRVEAVKPFFERFLNALPDISHLAVCPEEELLKLWEGLGYYNRVRNMQKAARIIKEHYHGEMPRDYEALQALPGIGSYTAGAVASIAFRIPVPAVDGNVLRVISRLRINEEDIQKQSVKKKIEADILKIIPKGRPDAFNQALMELGAIVCIPNGMAKCEICPLNKLCLANTQNRVMEFPKKAKKKPRKIEQRTILIIRDGERAAICRRPEKGLLAGLYEPPNLIGHLSDDEVIEYLKKHRISPVRIQKLPSAKHIFSHIEWQMIGYLIRVEELEEDHAGDMLFIEPRETENNYPIPAAYAKYMEYLKIR